jgi:hypothetical protein
MTTPPEPVRDDLVPPAGRANASPWAAYATGEWFKLDVLNDAAIVNARGLDYLGAARKYAGRHDLSFEHRDGPERLPHANRARFVFVRFTPKGTA